MSIDIEDWAAGVSVKRLPNEPECFVDLLYPPKNGDDSTKVRTVTIGMCDVRASDEVQVSFDFPIEESFVAELKSKGGETITVCKILVDSHAPMPDATYLTINIW